MNQWSPLAASVLVVSCLSGCVGNSVPSKALEVMKNAESLELLSLDPDKHLLSDEEGSFHRWKVLGRATIKDAATRTKLIDALQKGAAENDGAVAACFNPRHGIRATQGKEVIELVICFECMSAQVYLNGKRIDQYLTTSSPQGTFNEVLKGAGVALPKQAE